jgi:CubicO group peptidase (beta-lactamase class C family)
MEIVSTNTQSRDDAVRRQRMATEWPTIEPVDVGFAPDLAERIAEAQRTGRLAGLHGLVIVRQGKLVLEQYGAGEDSMWGDSLGSVAFGPDTLHDLRSVSKSVVGLLYGIALANGQAPEPSEPLLRHFPEYPDLAADPEHAALTVGQALTMTLGLDWHEDVPYTSVANSEVAMEFAPDRYRFVLERPIVEEPGVRWSYCGGATALLGALIARGSGRTLQDFARGQLFGPLGIKTFEWMAGRDGVASPASGLRLAPRDLARIGQMVLNRGVWHCREVVPATWIAEMLRPRVQIGDGREYGYQWYLGSSPLPGRDQSPLPWAGANGNGGQRLFVFPGPDLVVAQTAGNYDAANQSALSTTILNDLILPAIVR